MDSSPGGGVEYGTTFGTPGISSTQSLLLATTSGSSLFHQGGIQQTIATVPGQLYSITIEAKADNSQTGTSGTVSFGGQPFTLSSLTQSWTGFTWSETATSSSTILDLIGYTSSLVNKAVVVSDLTVTAVPTAWVGGTSSDWATASNWNTNSVPNAAGYAVTFGIGERRDRALSVSRLAAKPWERYDFMP